MGADKAILPVGDRPLITRAADALLECVDRVIVVGRTPERYQWALAGRRVDYARDRLVRAGPLAGIHAGLSALTDEIGAIAVGCDMPFISTGAVDYLASKLVERADSKPRESRSCRVFAFSDLEGRHQHLLAALSRSATGQLEAYLQTDKSRSIGAFFASVGAHYTPISSILSHDECERTFWNVNTPEDLQRARSVADSSP